MGGLDPLDVADTQSAGYDIAITGGTVVVAGRGAVEADIAVSGETIAAIVEPGTSLEATEHIDASGRVVMPGVIDSHVHWGYKGDFVEQCRADSRAALVGGTTTVHLLQRAEPDGYPRAIEQASEVTSVDFFMTPSVFDTDTSRIVPDAVTEWGCPSIKFYLAYRDLPDAPSGDDWNMLTDGLWLEALASMGEAGASLACVHAENPEVINHAWPVASARDDGGLRAWEAAHPEIGEVEAILRSALYAEESSVALYLVHLSGARSVEALERARATWPFVYGETCPHYLIHNVEDSSQEVKFSPPVRQPRDNEVLWDALASGVLDCVGSDSASTRRAAKVGGAFESMRGGPGQGTLLPVVLSEGVNTGRLTVERAAEVTSTNAARIFGLYPQKGVIEVGADADLVVVDLDLERTPSHELLGTWSDHNLYADRTLRGWPVLTMLRGRVVCRELDVLAEAGSGRYLKRAPQQGLGRLPGTER
ncbi:MAG: dihydroorotase [Gaiellaceae bacterium]